MSYIKSFGDGFDFNDLKDALFLSGFKPGIRNMENQIGLHGFNGLGKSHGTGTLALAMLYGGSAALGAMGGAGAGAGAGGSSLFGSSAAPGFSGTQAAAPIVDLSTPASSTGVTEGFGQVGKLLGGGGGMQMPDMGQQRRQPTSQSQQPIHWQAPYNPHNDPAVQSTMAEQQRRAVADALLAQQTAAGYKPIGSF
jgi:hypothetical protein